MAGLLAFQGGIIIETSAIALMGAASETLTTGV
jgi:hypothetical protein